MRLGIVGTGLIGTSIGLRASRLGWDVAAWDADAANLAAAAARGAVGTASSSLTALAQLADVLVLATPLDATLAQLAALAADPPPQAELVLDVASLQAPVARAGRTLGVFVATHPLAGSERSGPAAAHDSLFEGRTWTYDPTAAAEPRARAVAFIEAMGAYPFAMDSDAHDRVVALTSHLPQLLSVALATQLGARLDDPQVGALCGGGIASMLRLASSSWEMWRPVYARNAPAVAQEVRQLVGILTDAADALERGESDALERAFAAAAEAVARLAADSPAAGSATTEAPLSGALSNER